jgi:putative two-component system response regulator
VVWPEKCGTIWYKRPKPISLVRRNRPFRKGPIMDTVPAARQHVLVVDDDATIARLLEQLLRAAGHRVTVARDGREGLDRVAERPPDLILLDLDMPALGGFEVCGRLKQDPATRLIPVVILTGQNAPEARLRAWELGADDFLTKPFLNVEVLARCLSFLRLKTLLDELDSAEAVVFAFARAVEAKCRYTRGHAERVADYALGLANRLGLPGPDHELLSRGALLHDVGKISTPDAILNKPGPLTPEEYAIIKQDPAQGARIVEPLRSVRAIVPLIRWHHERLDGRGYPDGLCGGQIPLLTRVLAVADVYDALTSERPYRAAVGPAASLEVLRADAAASGLDAELVRCFCATPPVPRAGPAAAKKKENS